MEPNPDPDGMAHVRRRRRRSDGVEMAVDRGAGADTLRRDFRSVDQRGGRILLLDGAQRAQLRPRSR